MSQESEEKTSFSSEPKEGESELTAKDSTTSMSNECPHQPLTHPYKRCFQCRQEHYLINDIDKLLSFGTQSQIDTVCRLVRDMNWDNEHVEQGDD